MIAKGTTHNNGVKLAAYMSTAKDGERVELWQLNGFEADNIKDAFRDVQIMADGTRCDQPFFHVQVRNREGETLTRQQWEYTASRIESMLGLTGQPRAIAFHTYEHNGDEHMHVAWSRIDEDRLKAKRLPFFKDRLKKISRELELHFAFEPVKNERDGPIKYAPTKAQDEQARRLGVDIHAVRNTIRECYDQSDCGRSFQAALEHAGLILAKGDQRDLVVVDHAGGIHSLSKRILDVTKSKIRARLADLNEDGLPSVDEARAFVGETSKEKKHDRSRLSEKDLDSATVRDDVQWEEKLANAAIEKEKAKRQFTEPKDRDKEQKAGRKEENQHATKAENPLSKDAASIRLAFNLSQSPDGFIKNLADIGFTIACVTKVEAERSHINAAFAKEIGRFAPDYREGEFVALNERGNVYSLNKRTTGRSREAAQDFMRTADQAKVLGIEDTRRQISIHKKPTKAREVFPAAPVITGGIPMPSHADALNAWQQFGRASQEATQRDKPPEELHGNAADIWTAYQRNDNARSFVAALKDRNIDIALVTREDVTTNEINQRYAADFNPNRYTTPAKIREGDYVAVTEVGRVFNLNYRTTGEKADTVQKFMSSLNKAEFQSVADVRSQVQERAELHELHRQAFRDLSTGKFQHTPLAKPTGRLGGPTKTREIVAGTRKLVARSASITGTAISTAAKAFDFLGGLMEAVAAPPLTPEQKRDAEVSKIDREAAADAAITFSRYNAEESQHRQQSPERQAPRDQRDRGGGRER